MTPHVDAITLAPVQIIQHWGWFLVMGIGLICLAMVAWIRSARASLDSIYLFGWLFIVASAIEALNAYTTGGWSGFYLHLVGAILFGVTGYMLLKHTRNNAEITSLIVAMYFIIAGIFYIVAPLTVNVLDSGWHIWAGFITLLLGPALLGDWKVKRFQLSKFQVIGVFIGIDLFFRGLALTFFARDLRSLFVAD
jgi:uncharacterized membrane protein HdeD (DUF308 family)